MLGYWNYQDRALERCLWAFAEPVVVFPEGKDPAGYAVRGIWETPATQAPLGLPNQGLSNQSTTIAFRILELPDAEIPTQGLQVEARATRWEVVDVEQDGGGWVHCRLFKIGPGALAPLPPVDDGAPIPEPVPLAELLG